MKKRKISKSAPASKGRPGQSLEEITARIQQMLDPNSSVTHDETLVDRVGNNRQFDVVIRGHFAGRPILGVMECKDHSRRKGPDVVEAFSKKSENLGANLRLMVSKNGFTKAALKLAKHENVGCLSMLPAPHESLGFSIGQMVYGVIQKWTKIRLAINFAPPAPPLLTLNPHSVKWKGKQVVKWFTKELLTTYRDETETGEKTLTIAFGEPQQIEIECVNYPVQGIACIAERVCINKRKWISWSGDAFFDWHTGSITLPVGVELMSSELETDLSTWPDYGGEILDPDMTDTGSLLRVAIYYTQKWNENENDAVPDLMNM